MKPVEFLIWDDEYNLEVGKLAKALKKNIKIYSDKGEMEVLSYYYCDEDKCMVLDVQHKDTE